MRIEALEFLIARVKACSNCQESICHRHEEVLRFLMSSGWFKAVTYNGKLLFLQRIDEPPLVALWKREDGRYQFDFIHTHVCYSYRTHSFPSLASTGDLLLKVAMEDYWIHEDQLKQLVPLPFQKISVSGYRDPHSDYCWTISSRWGDPTWREELESFIESWAETLTLPEVGEVRVFARELYGPLEGATARGFFMHIPGTDIISSLKI